MVKKNPQVCMDFPQDDEVELQNRILKPQSWQMGSQALLVSERIREVMQMCDRENPIYEQISSFSIALYVIGYVDCEDLMSFQDIEQHEAATILDEDFTPAAFDDIPMDYIITESQDNYLIVIGDPIFPVHFAVITSRRGVKPYFSKMPFFGSGFDSLAELKSELDGTDGVDDGEIHCFKELRSVPPPPSSMGKIYIVN
jgi:hypothetical protein